MKNRNYFAKKFKSSKKNEKKSFFLFFYFCTSKSKINGNFKTEKYFF